MNTPQYDMADDMSHGIVLSHEIEKRDAEINELKAMVGALQVKVSDVYSSYFHSTGFEPSISVFHRGLDELNELCDTSPSQCLANVKADAVQSFAVEIGISGRAVTA